MDAFRGALMAEEPRDDEWGEDDGDGKTVALDLNELPPLEETTPAKSATPVADEDEDDDDDGATMALDLSTLPPLEGVSAPESEEGSAPDAEDDDAAEDDDGATVALDLSTLPPLDGGDAPESEEAPAAEEAAPVAAEEEDDDEDEATVALDLSTLPPLDGGDAPEAGQDPAPVAEEDEATVALDLSDFEALEEAAPAPPAPEDEGDEERTVAMDLSDQDFGDQAASVMSDVSDLIEDGTPSEAATMMMESPLALGPKATLTIVEGPESGKVLDLLDHSIMLGRSLECDLVINDSATSRKHFRLEETEHSYRLIDMESGNGTVVGRRNVANVELKHGALIGCGETIFQYELVDPPQMYMPLADMDDRTRMILMVVAVIVAAGLLFWAFSS